MLRGNAKRVALSHPLFYAGSVVSARAMLYSSPQNTSSTGTGAALSISRCPSTRTIQDHLLAAGSLSAGQVVDDGTGSNTFSMAAFDIGIPDPA